MKEKNDPLRLDELSKFFFEVSMLKRTQRTGYAFLGTGMESTASHSFSTAIIAFVLSKMAGADQNKAMLMALIHDIPEARTGDANAVHKKYIKRDEKRAMKEALKRCNPCQDMLSIYEEYQEGKSKEALLVRDADQIDMLISLKEQLDCGNENARMWIPYVVKRLKCQEAKKLSERILNTHWASWWMDEYEE